MEVLSSDLCDRYAPPFLKVCLGVKGETVTCSFLKCTNEKDNASRRRCGKKIHVSAAYSLSSDLVGSWEQLMADDTTALSYWLNWRFFLSALWIFIALIVASVLIIKYEVINKKKSHAKEDEHDVEPVGILYEDETWRTSIKAVHPAWLLVFRLFAFGIMLALLITNLILDGAEVLFFYTQWTFTLVTFYFGLASSFSIYGCYKYWNEVGDDNISKAVLDPERGTYVAPSVDESSSHNVPINQSNHGVIHARKTAGIWGYFFQIIFQICSGAVGLTDSVFWFILYPFFTPADYSLTFLDVSMHSVNAILLLIDMVLNRLRFPFFRLAYFGLWTCIFVIFQWIVHACVSMW